MASYVFTDKAERDLETIIDFTVERWGTFQAIQYIPGRLMNAFSAGLNEKNRALSGGLD